VLPDVVFLMNKDYRIETERVLVRMITRY